MISKVGVTAASMNTTSLTASSVLDALYTKDGLNRGSLDWNSLQLGNNDWNYIIGGRSNPGGGFKFVVNNTNNYRNGISEPDGITAITIPKTGYVGIGTEAPTSNLQIDSPLGPVIRLTRSSVSAARFDMEVDGSNMKIGPRDSGDLSFHSGAWSETVRIKSNGNVGIGLSNPSERLDVSGNLRLTGGGRSILFSDPGGYDFSVVNNDGSTLDIRSPEFEGGKTIASFTNGGKVGIGTSTPQAKLDVAGPIKFSGQKMCRITREGIYTFAILVPQSWTEGTCARFRDAHMATIYNTGCLFENDFSFGPNNGGVPTPNCGW